jgi:hypothetical protein
MSNAIVVHVDDLPIVWSEKFHRVRYAIDAAQLRTDGVVEVTDNPSHEILTGTELLLVCRLVTVALNDPRSRRTALADYVERRPEFIPISIRGRLAFHAHGLEGARSKHTSEMAEIVWQFVERRSPSQFVAWERDVKRLASARHVDQPIAGLLRLTTQTCIGNAYAGVVGASVETLVSVVLFRRELARLGLPVPAMDGFRISEFAESHGWGNARPRAVYKT